MPKKSNSRIRPQSSYLILAGFIVITLFVTYLLYLQVQDLFKQRLQERLLSMASTASLMFAPDDLERINGPESIGTTDYIDTINKLNRIRYANADIRYAYILRKTEDPDIFEFVADADSLDPSAEFDLNGDGVIDGEDQLNTPGDPYDVSEFYELKNNAFIKSTVDAELTEDQWGKFLSSSAPIRDKFGNSNAMIGLDVDVSDFVRISNLALIPYILFVAFLLLILIALTVFLVKIWGQRVDQLQELDRQKDELLGIVAHQLAKPITAIRWDLESLLDGDLGQMNNEQKKEANVMRGQAVNLADLVSMILDVSRIQLGKMQLTPQPLNLNEFFTEILQVVEPTVEQKKLNFIKNMPKILPTVLLDKRYTRMTVENLLTNAVKYTPDGGTVTFDLSIENGIMHCSVTDTGCGIPKEDQGKIFGKMYRASNVRNTVEGNGFGLYVAKGAIEGQGGKMWFTSEVGKGTTFSFELPMKEAPKN